MLIAIQVRGVCDSKHGHDRLYHASDTHHTPEQKLAYARVSSAQLCCGHAYVHALLRARLRVLVLACVVVCAVGIARRSSLHLHFLLQFVMSARFVVGMDIDIDVHVQDVC
jgi:hypothetical protein